MKELSLEEAALAWAQGKRVECLHCNHVHEDDWKAVDGVGECEVGKVSQHVFGLPAIYRFRLAPEPPAKKFRPYRRAELDGVSLLGGQVVRKDRKHRMLVIGVLEESVHIGNSHYTFENLLNEFTWCDGSPCGVEVDA